MSTFATRDPAPLHPRDFPSFHAYQAARKRELTRARIRNMRATNRHLSLAQIAGYTGVSIDYVRDALSLPASYPAW